MVGSGETYRHEKPKYEETERFAKFELEVTGGFKKIESPDGIGLEFSKDRKRVKVSVFAPIKETTDANK